MPSPAGITACSSSRDCRRLPVRSVSKCRRASKAVTTTPESAQRDLASAPGSRTGVGPSTPADLLSHYGELVTTEVERMLEVDDDSYFGEIVASYPSRPAK